MMTKRHMFSKDPSPRIWYNPFAVAVSSTLFPEAPMAEQHELPALREVRAIRSRNVPHREGGRLGPFIAFLGISFAGPRMQGRPWPGQETPEEE